MTDELKPVHCGCGGEAHHDSLSCWNPEEEEWMPSFWHKVICKNCGTQTKSFYTEAEAIKAWNRAMGNVQKMHDPLVHCKDCKHYAEDVFAYADHTPIIVAHGACKVWGGPLGSKTDPEGWCYLGVRKEDNDGDTDAKA